MPVPTRGSGFELAGEVLEGEGPAGHAATRSGAADAESGGLLDDRVPLAAGFAFALPALGDRSAVLTNIGRTQLGHGAEVAALSRPVEEFDIEIGFLGGL